MQKFTAFTIILTIVVVVVAAETFVNKYLPSINNESEVASESPLPRELDISASMQSNVLGAGDLIGEAEESNQYEQELTETASLTTSTEQIPDSLSTEEQDILGASSDIYTEFEDFSGSYEQTTTNVLLTNEDIVKSGFSGAYLTPEAFDGFLFKTVNIGDLYGVTATKNNVTNGTTTFLKVYIVTAENTDEIYETIKVRAADGLETEVNETNDLGQGSFFMNDSRRSEVAFLTVKINGKIYGFSYPKQYHPQVKALISNLILK